MHVEVIAMMQPTSIDRPFTAEKPRGWIWLASIGTLTVIALLWPIRRADALCRRWRLRGDRRSLVSHTIAQAVTSRARRDPAESRERRLVTPAASSCSAMVDPAAVFKNRQQRVDDDPRWREQVFKLDDRLNERDVPESPPVLQAGSA
jgi:hypothetical protein